MRTRHAFEVRTLRLRLVFPCLSGPSVSDGFSSACHVPCLVRCFSCGLITIFHVHVTLHVHAIRNYHFHAHVTQHVHAMPHVHVSLHSVMSTQAIVATNKFRPWLPQTSFGPCCHQHVWPSLPPTFSAFVAITVLGPCCHHQLSPV